jgi:hypothetical protein
MYQALDDCKNFLTKSFKINKFFTKCLLNSISMKVILFTFDEIKILTKFYRIFVNASKFRFFEFWFWIWCQNRNFYFGCDFDFILTAKSKFQRNFIIMSSKFRCFDFLKCLYQFWNFKHFSPKWVKISISIAYRNFDFDHRHLNSYYFR